MKKLCYTLLFASALSYTTFGQKEKTKKYKEIFYKDISVESADYSATTNNAWSNKEFTKFKLKIINKSPDMLWYKPEESSFNIGSNNYKPKEKQMYVSPGESNSKVINYPSNEFLVTSYSYNLDGIYKISLEGTTQEAADFKLPASTNEFKAGNFSCKLVSLTKETDKTEAKFDCVYNGDKIGVINPSRAAVKLPDGTELANEKKWYSISILSKGQSEKIAFKWNRMEGGRATDMQKIDLFILFRNTFTEAEAVKAKSEVLNFEIDEKISK